MNSSLLITSKNYTISTGFMKNLLTLFKKVKDLPLLPFLVPSLTIYFFVHLVFWPSQMSPDSETQWSIHSLIHSSGHPFMSTLWLWPAKFIGSSPALIIIINYTLFSVFTALILVIFSKQCHINKNMCIVFSFVFPLIPVNFMLLTTLWKDIPYTVGYVILLYASLKLIYTEQKIRLSTFVLFFSGLFLIFFMRHNGMIAVTGILLSYLILKPSFKKVWLALGLTLLFIFIIIRSLYFVNNITEIPTRYTALHSVHYLAYLLHEETPLDETDSQFLSEVMPLETWKSGYKHNCVGYLCHQGYFKNPAACTKEAQSKINTIGFKYLTKHPLHFFTYKYMSQIKPLTKFYAHPGFTCSNTASKFTDPLGTQSSLLRSEFNKFSINFGRYFTPWFFLYACVFFYFIRKYFFSTKSSSISKNEKGTQSSLVLTGKNFTFLMVPPIMNIGSLIVINTEDCYRYYYPTLVVSCFILFMILTLPKNLSAKQDF